MNRITPEMMRAFYNELEKDAGLMTALKAGASFVSPYIKKYTGKLAASLKSDGKLRSFGTRFSDTVKKGFKTKNPASTIVPTTTVKGAVGSTAKKGVGSGVLSGLALTGITGAGAAGYGGYKYRNPSKTRNY